MVQRFTSDVLRVFHSLSRISDGKIVYRIIQYEVFKVHVLVTSTLSCFRYLVEMEGFEPLTPCLQGRCSPN